MREELIAVDKDLFDQLHQSAKEAVAIAKGEMQPSRIFTIEPQEVNATPEISEHTKTLSAVNQKSYATLQAKMTPESRARSAEQTKAILQEMQAVNSVGNGQ